MLSKSCSLVVPLENKTGLILRERAKIYPYLKIYGNSLWTTDVLSPEALLLDA